MEDESEQVMIKLSEEVMELFVGGSSTKESKPENPSEKIIEIVPSVMPSVSECEICAYVFNFKPKSNEDSDGVYEFTDTPQ